MPHVERNPKANFCLSGPVRAMSYQVALGTGFRVKELRTLTPASFDLDSDPPAVTVGAAYSKRRRQDLQPIRPDLAELLRPWLAGFPRDAQLFKLPHNTAKMFRRDLAAARAAWIAEARTDSEREERERSDFLQYENAAGEFADVHAQRHTYISGIVAGGASVKTCQELARHSTPVLTIGRYSHARLHDLTGALDSLPDLQPQEPTTAQEARATGTDCMVPVLLVGGKPDSVPVLPAERQQLDGEKCQKVANSGERNDFCLATDSSSQPVVL
jgi:integrase